MSRILNCPASSVTASWPVSSDDAHVGERLLRVPLADRPLEVGRLLLDELLGDRELVAVGDLDRDRPCRRRSPARRRTASPPPTAAASKAGPAGLEHRDARDLARRVDRDLQDDGRALARPPPRTAGTPPATNVTSFGGTMTRCRRGRSPPATGRSRGAPASRRESAPARTHARRRDVSCASSNAEPRSSPSRRPAFRRASPARRRSLRRGLEPTSSSP